MLSVFGQQGELHPRQFDSESHGNRLHYWAIRTVRSVTHMVSWVNEHIVPGIRRSERVSTQLLDIVRTTG